jgi:hypothetical protein
VIWSLLGNIFPTFGFDILTNVHVALSPREDDTKFPL